MPYPTAKSFRKHNKNAVGKVGQRAANIATGIIDREGERSAGKAIRIANAYIKRNRGRGLIDRGR